MITPSFEWSIVNATLKTGNVIDHVQVRVRASVPSGEYADFFGEVELPKPDPDQLVLPLEDINQDTLLRWAKNVNGPDNNDIFQACAAEVLEGILNPAATFCPSA